MASLAHFKAYSNNITMILLGKTAGQHQWKITSFGIIFSFLSCFQAFNSTEKKVEFPTFREGGDRLG